MSRVMILTATAVVAAAMTLPVLPASAQIDVYVSPSPPVYVAPSPMYVTPVPPYAYVPPRQGAWGDRDRDGIPNIADNYNNNRDRNLRRHGWGGGDADHDGVKNRFDSRPNNPWRQ
jgi:hypothetical protein